MSFVLVLPESEWGGHSKKESKLDQSRDFASSVLKALVGGWHLLCRVSKWDSVFSSTRTETGLAAVAWERWNLKLGNRKGQESYLGESLTERWRGGW